MIELAGQLQQVPVKGECELDPEEALLKRQHFMSAIYKF
jgi:hypothetical protein